MENLLVASVHFDEIIAPIIFGLAILFAVRYYIANEFMIAAQEKGYYEKKYLWITFLLGITGMLLIIALPNKRGTKEMPAQDESSELPTL